jgi:transposase-like protein
MDQNSGSTSKRRKVYTDEFRRSVVEHLLASDKPVAHVAREFGIPAGMLRVWKVRYGPRDQWPDASAPKTPVVKGSNHNFSLPGLFRFRTFRILLARQI